MIEKLIAKIKKTNAPIVVGLDPMLSYVPDQIVKKSFAEYGETLEGAADAIWQFNKEIVDATCDLIPAVKPQIAMYGAVRDRGPEGFQKDGGLLPRKRLSGDWRYQARAISVPHRRRMQPGIWGRCRWGARCSAVLTRTL